MIGFFQISMDRENSEERHVVTRDFPLEGGLAIDFICDASAQRVELPWEKAKGRHTCPAMTGDCVVSHWIHIARPNYEGRVGLTSNLDGLIITGAWPVSIGSTAGAIKLTSRWPHWDKAKPLWRVTLIQDVQKSYR
jgi:hypothetical protein